jgi:hypothetical protein
MTAVEVSYFGAMTPQFVVEKLLLNLGCPDQRN